MAGHTDRRRIDELRERLREAFPVRPIPHWPIGRSQGIENAHCRKHLAGKPWDAVDVKSALESYECCLYVEESLIRYYLPAQLDALLATWPQNRLGQLWLHLELYLTREFEGAALPSRYTRLQRGCVAEFLDIMAESQSEEENGERCRLAAERWASID